MGALVGPSFRPVGLRLMTNPKDHHDYHGDGEGNGQQKLQAARHARNLKQCIRHACLHK
jgi:hypothetical protein